MWSSTAHLQVYPIRRWEYQSPLDDFVHSRASQNRRSPSYYFRMLGHGDYCGLRYARRPS